MKTVIAQIQLCELDTTVTAINGLELLNKDHFNHCV
jgi:hypothetical protein